MKKQISALASFRHQDPLARLASVVVALTTAIMLAVGVGPAYAVHDNGMFELDGNVAHNSANTPPYDWASLFDSSGNRIVTPDPDNGPVLASTFVQDTTTPDQTYFAQNKDIEPISAWGCGPINNPTDKDDLQNSYAALVQVPDGAGDNAGHKVLYLGSERDSNNGTSFAGFWLLKDRGVGCNPPGDFTGGHTDGDILVVSDYTNGGGTQDVSVYKWIGGDTTSSSTNNLELVASGGVCGGAANDDICAIANNASLTTPWSPTTHETNTFVETGIDLTHVLGAGGCFTTFLAETRSSAELTATLKDYAGGQFNTCPPAPVTTTASPGGSVNAPGSAQHDVATVSAVGGRPTPTGSIAFYLCDPTEITAAGCPTGGTLVSTNDLVDGSVSSGEVGGAATSAPGKYCWRAQYTPDTAAALEYVSSSHTNDGSECFTVVHASPTITTQIIKNSINGGQQPGLGFTSLGDTATLHGFVPGTVTGDTVAFDLYDVTADPGCTGSVVFNTSGTLNAAGEARTDDTFTPTAAHTYVWIASYGGDYFNDPVTGLCSDADESVTIAGARITVGKAANPAGPVSAGATIGFDITVSNPGAVAATGTTVTDNLPAKAGGAGDGDLDWSIPDPGFTGCAISGAVGSQVLTCNLGTVAGGASVGPIHVQSATTPIDCGVVSNTATVGTTNGTGGNSNTASVTVQCPGLNITKTADADSVDAGSPIGFTVTVSNSGEGTATDVNLSDPLPSGPGITWSIAGSTGADTLTCTVDSGDLTCSGSLAPGASHVVHVTSPTQWTGSGESEVNSCLGGPDEDGIYPNTATVSASNVSQSPPPASAQTQVLCPDLHVTKTAGAAAVNAGSQIGFTITASNTGAGDATGALVHDPLPGGVAWSIDASGTSGPLECGISSGTLTCGGTLAAGATETVHVTAPTSTASCATYDNTVTLTATNTPQSPTASARTTVVCPQVIVSPPKPPQVSPPAVLPNTGGPDVWLPATGLALLLAGGALVVADRRHRRRS
jgi:uncharacterized repeat protein (TIGR01451 family)/LPXTG-motif cell wall-anchored protein